MKGERSSSVLFVCLGNICRSPTAEAVMKMKIDKWKQDNSDKPELVDIDISVDSCGTGGGSSDWYDM